MNILVLGSGGREHAFSLKLAESPQCSTLFIAPGNAGTAQVGTNVPLDILNFPEIEAFAREKQIGLIVVGPEAPLAAGIADYFESTGIPLLGPSQQAAQLESSKAFAKEFMQKYGIPTAAYRTFKAEQMQEALAYVRSHTLPVVVKASGLAAGKGVLICEDHAQAELAVTDMLSGSSFGSSGETIVIEQFLSGIELSVFILTDGNSYKLLPSAKDYKRIGEGDTGLNTGGMGAVSPLPFADAKYLEKVAATIIQPTLDGLRKENIPYKGFIFIGLINVGDEPYVIEYNVRMGDPETEVVFPLLKADMAALLLAASQGNLHEQQFSVRDQACATVMLVSGGYPGKYEKGKPISGIDSIKNGIVFHAGTRADGNKILTNGGRVLALTSFGDDLESALKRCMKNAEKIKFEGKYFRKDIGQDVLGLEG